MNRVVDLSRFLFLFGVASAIILALLLFFYGIVLTVDTVYDVARDREFTTSGADEIAFEAIEVIDYFLLGTVFYIIALGLYSLFIDESHPMPAWLEIYDLDDLKHRLAGVVIVAMGVSFFGLLLQTTDPNLILRIGIGIGVVVVALTFFMRSQSEERFHFSVRNGEEQESGQFAESDRSDQSAAD